MAEERSSSIQFLGLQGGRILVDGRLARLESQSARDLGFLFVTHPEGLTREDLLTAMWPDRSAQVQLSLFISTLYRLKRAVGGGVVERRSGVYLVVRSAIDAHDADDFFRLATRGSGPGEDARQHRLAAIALCQSEYLPGCELDWCVAIRQAVKKELAALLLKEAALLALDGCRAEAETLCERVERLGPGCAPTRAAIEQVRARYGDPHGAEG